MYALNLPEAWEIEQLERRRRERELQQGEPATIPLHPWPEMAQERARTPEKRVIVIQIG